MREELTNSFILMVILQGIKLVVELFVETTTRFQSQMLTMVIMIGITILFLIFVKVTNSELSFFPEEWSKKYTIATGLVIASLILNPANFYNGINNIWLVIYGSVVTPIYEELVFRGYIWNKINEECSENSTYLVTSVLYGIWHLFYMIEYIIAGDFFAVLSKLVVGLACGFVLGYLKLKTKNTYSTVLLHAFLNLFLG